MKSSVQQFPRTAPHQECQSCADYRAEIEGLQRDLAEANEQCQVLSRKLDRVAQRDAIPYERSPKAPRSSAMLSDGRPAGRSGDERK